jgi:Ca2+-binding EF-hand superfamily protein
MKPTIIAACALLALSVTACAREGAAPNTAPAPPAASTAPATPAAQVDDRARRRLERFDTDKDGRVSLAEFTTNRSEPTARQGAEAQPKERRTPEEQFRRRDKNTDGFLTADEMGGRERKGGKNREGRDNAAVDDVAAEDDAL